MTEVAVALSDYALTVECVIFALLLRRKPALDRPLRASAISLFLSLALASLMGGTCHGFFATSHLLWSATLLGVGLTAVSCWALGASLIADRKWFPRIVAVAIVSLGVYLPFILEKNAPFLYAIAYYLPAVIFLFVVFVRRYLADKSKASRPAVLGLGLTFVAAGIQQGHVSLGIIDHNTLYHLVQAVGLFLLGTSLLAAPTE